MKHADKSKYRFVELLEDLFEKNECSSKIKCQIEPAVWLPSVSSRTDVGNMPMEYHKEIVLLENALDDPETFIDKIYNFYNMKDLTYLTPNIADLVVDAFAPHFRAVASLKHILEVIPLARNNEKEPVGIVLNAFSEPFVLDKEIWDIV